jgi:hypothetical protein
VVIALSTQAVELLLLFSVQQFSEFKLETQSVSLEKAVEYWLKWILEDDSELLICCGVFRSRNA